MTTPTLALGITAAGADQIIKLAGAVASLRTDLASLHAQNGGMRGQDVGGLGDLVSQMTRMRREAAVAIAGLRTELADGFSKAYGGAARAVKEGGDQVVAATEKAAAKVRIAGQKFDLGGGLTASTSGSGLKSAAKVAELDKSLAALPAVIEAAAIKNVAAGEKWLMSVKLNSAKMTGALVDDSLKQKAASDEWLNVVKLNSAKMTGALSDQALKQQLASDKWLRSVQIVSSKMAAAQAEAAAKEIAALDLAERTKDAAYRAASERGRLRMVVRARSQLDSGVASDVVSSRFGSSASSAAMGASSLTALQRDLENVHSSSAKASAGMSLFGSQLNNAHSAARGLASGFGAMWLTWGNIMPLLAGAAISHSLVQVVKMGSEVQNTFETIRVLSEETGQSITNLTTQMDTLARTGPYGPRQIAEAMKTLSLAGLSAKQVGGAIQDVLNFALAGTTSIAQAADVLTSVGSSFKIQATEYSYIGDIISKAAAVSKSSVESMGNAFKSASTVNSLYGVSLKDVGVNLALLANIGIQNSAAGTALTNMYIDFAGRTPKATKALKELGVVALDPLTGKMRELGPLFQDLLKQLGTKMPLDQLKYINDIFAQRSRKDVVALMDSMRQTAREGGEAFKNEFDRIAAEISNSAGFQTMAAIAMSMTPLNQMKSVVATLEADLVGAFTNVSPYVLRLTQQLKDLFNSAEFKNGLEVTATSFIRIISGLVTVVGWMSKLSESIPVVSAISKLWETYGKWSDKAAESAGTMQGTFAATIEGLKNETDRLLKVNEAKREGISLDQQASNAVLAKSMAEAQAPVLAAQAEVNRLEGKTRSPGGGQGRGMGGDFQRQRADMASLVTARELLAVEQQTAASKVQQVKDLADGLKMASQMVAIRATADRPVPPHGDGTRPDSGKPGKTPGMNVDNDAVMLEETMRTRVRVINDGYSKERQILDAKHQAGVAKEGEYQATLLSLTSDYESKQVALVQQAQQDSLKEYGERTQEARSKFAGPALQQELDNLKNRYVKFSEETDGILEKVANESSLRRQLATIKEDGETLKLQKTSEEFWTHVEAGIKKENDLATARNTLAGASETERARAEAVIKVRDQAEEQIARLIKGYKEAAEQLVYMTDSVDKDNGATLEQTGSIEALTRKIYGYVAAIELANSKKGSLEQMAGDSAALQVQNKAFQQMRVDADKMSKDVASNLASNLADALLEGAKDGGQKMRDWLKNYFIREPLKVLLQAMLQPVGNMVSNFAYGGMAGQGPMSSGGIFGGMGNGSGLTGLMGGVMGSSSAYASMIPGLSATGAGSQAAMLAAQTGEFGMAGLGMTASAGGSAFGGAMTALSTAMPYIAAAMLAISLLSSKGGGPKTEAGYTTGGLDISGIDIGGKSQGSVRGDVSAAKGISTGISASYSALAKGLGLSQKQLDVGIFYAMDNAEGGTSMTQLQVTSSSGYNRSNRAGGIENVARGDSSLRAALATETLYVLIDALKKSDLGNKYKEYLNAIPENADDAALQKALDTVMAVKQLQDLLANLGGSFGSLAALSVEAANSMAEMSGGVQSLMTNLNAYYTNFYTEEERKNQTASNIARAVNGAGGSVTSEQVLNYSRDDFRRFAEAQDLTSESGRSMYTVLMSVAQAFAEIHPVVAKVAVEVQNAADALKLLQDSTDKAYSAYSAAIDREKALWQTRLQVSTELRDSLKSLFDLLTAQISEIRGEVASTASSDAGSARAFIARSLSTAQTTGYMPDSAALGSAITSARGGINQKDFSSAAEFEFAKLVLAGQLSQLRDIAGPQLSAAEQAMQVAQDQLKALDDQLAYWKQQIDIARGNSSSLLSIQDSLLALRGALVKETGGKVGSVASSAAAAGASGGAFAGVQGSVGGAGAAGIDWVDFQGYFDQVGFMPSGPGLIAKYLMAYGQTQAAAATALKLPLDTVQSYFSNGGIQAFEAGGFGGSGIHMTGENGPELKASGPARYWTAQETAGMLGGGGGGSAGSEAMLLVLGAINDRMKAVEEAASKTARILEQVSGGGGPFLTTAVT